MSSDNSKFLRGKINRLTREIEQIDEHFYRPSKDDDLPLMLACSNVNETTWCVLQFYRCTRQLRTFTIP